MPDSNTGTLEALGIELVNILLPIKQRVDDDEMLLLLAELGVQFPPSLKSDPGFSSAMNELVTQITEMPDLVKAIIEAIAAEEYGTVAEKSAELTQKIIETIEDFKTVEDALDDFPMGGLNAGQQTDLDDFIGNFVRNLFDYLLIQYLDSKSKAVTAGFELFGIIERSIKNEGSTDPVFPEFTKYRLHLNNIGEFLSNPGKILADLYGWGKPDFTGAALLKQLHKIAIHLGLPAVYTDAGPELDIMFLKLTPDLGMAPLPGLSLLIAENFSIDGGFATGNDDWSLTGAATASIPVQAGITLSPTGDVTLTPPTPGPFNGDFSLTFRIPGAGGPSTYILLGDANASRFEFKQFRALAGVGLTWNAIDGSAQGRFKIEGEIEDGKIVIKPSNPDGFLSQILPEEGFAIDLSLLFGYDSDRGFYFDGSGGLQIQVAINIQLGPLSIQSLTLGLNVGTDGIPLEIGANLGLTLGPFAAVVENMGIKTTLSFPADNSGNLGPANLDVDFKPPSGVGLAIDAGVVKGGGYLSFDFDAGKYTGIVQLSIQEVVNVIAIGILTTKGPDGNTDDYSLLLLITAEFTPIQLGFGFTLNGVGGLVGVNRTMELQALRDGVRNNTLDNILFPSDPIANAPQIISSLETVFPQAQDRYTFGLMAKLGWGTPTLISLELGLMLEVPNPIRLAILGVIKMVLPTEEAAVLKLQVNFVGTIDFEAKYLTFDASLFDSKLLTFTLEGDMALRVKWGDDSTFLFTVGGFHPDFVPPPLDLPDLRRLSISLLSGNPRLTVSAYFAVTSNTVQFGCAIDFYFGVSGFKVIGYLHFDALFQFNPFYFKISLAAGLGVYLGSSEILSIKLSGSLEGPTPWHITGRVKFKIFWVVNISVSVETTWGEEKNTSLPDVQVLPELKKALENKANWLTPLEASGENPDQLVTLRSIKNTDEDIIAHPNKSLSVSQKVVPLDLTIEKFGTQNPADYNYFHLDMVDGNGDDLAEVELKEEFAPDSFFNLSESERLSKPSFEKYNGGIEGTGSSELNSDFFREREVQFESIILDEPDPVPVLRGIAANEFNAFIKNGSIAKSPMGAKLNRESVLAPKPISIGNDHFSIVDVDDLSLFENNMVSSVQEAQAIIENVIAERPELEGQLEIIPSFELA